MSTSTADILSLIAARLNAARDDLQSAVAAYCEAQGREMAALKDSLDLATVAAQDLQRQLDAAMKRIRELEGEPEPQPPQKPKLNLSPLIPNGLSLDWSDAPEAAKVRLLPTGDLNRTPFDIDVSGSGGFDIELSDLRAKWSDADHQWVIQAELVVAGKVVAGPVTAQIPPKPSIPAEPKPPDIIITDPPYPQPPANAVYATSVAHAVQLRDESRRSGQPFVVRGLTIDSAQLPDRQLSLDGCKGPVWILDNDWRGDSKGFAAHQSPLFWDNERNIYIAGNTFRDMPKTCVIFAYGPQDCVIEGNRFENVRQPIHLILRESADAKLTIANNVGRGIGKIAVELQSSGFSRSNQFETRGVRITGNDMACIVGGEIVYSLACPSTRDMLVQGNTARQPVKGSAEDADKSHGGIGYSFELMAGILDGNRAIGSRIGYCLEGDMAPWGVTVKANNVYQGPGSRIGYQNRGERNPKHVIE